MFQPIPKPPKRGPKPRKPIPRTKPVRRYSKRSVAIRAKDKAFQQSGERHRCDVGHYAEQTCWHHRITRRRLATRWDERNCFRLCQVHHEEVERLEERRFLERYPQVLQVWQDRNVRPLPDLHGGEDLPH